MFNYLKLIGQMIDHQENLQKNADCANLCKRSETTVGWWTCRRMRHMSLGDWLGRHVDLDP